MPDRSEHPAAHVCRIYNDRLARSGSPLRWVLKPGGGMGLVPIERPGGTSVSHSSDHLKGPTDEIST